MHATLSSLEERRAIHEITKLLSPLGTSAPSYVTLAEPWAIYLPTPLYVLPNLITTTGSCLDVSSSPLSLGTVGLEVWGQLAPSIMPFLLIATPLLHTNWLERMCLSTWPDQGKDVVTGKGGNLG